MRSERRRGARLPEDPGYWEELAARSVDAAFGSSTAPAASRGQRAGVAGQPIESHAPPAHRPTRPWWGALSDASFMLAASAVLAVLGGSLLLDERTPVTLQPRAAAETHALMAALAPDDALLASLLDASAGPPTAAALLRLVALREVER